MIVHAVVLQVMASILSFYKAICCANHPLYFNLNLNLLNKACPSVPRSRITQKPMTNVNIAIPMAPYAGPAGASVLSITTATTSEKENTDCEYIYNKSGQGLVGFNLSLKCKVSS